MSEVPIPAIRADQITSWDVLLGQIRQRPGMYLGYITLTGLMHFLNGVQFAEFAYAIPGERQLVGSALDEFEEWTAARYNPDRLTIRSFDMALRIAASDEAAYQLWFEWYDQFRHDQARGSTTHP